MKNFPIIFGILLIISGCDVLTENPKAIATETFYNNADEVEGAVLSAYAPLRAIGLYAEMYPAQLTSMADYGYGRGSYVSVSAFQGLDGTNITRVGEMWTQLYQAIRNANVVIANAPRALETNPEKVNALIGEAKFIRALSYFQLVQNWGAVPLRTFENMIDENVPRTSTEEIFTLILNDLEDSEVHLWDNEPVMGRASKWAAKTLLSHVYLYLERWSDARDKALEVINSGKYALEEVRDSDDFYIIYGPNANSSEEIFYLKYNQTSGNTIGHLAHHPGAPYYNNEGWFAILTDASNKRIQEWNDDDLRKDFNLYEWDAGLGTQSLLYKKYIDPERDGLGRVDIPIYQYPEVLLFFAEADARANNGPTIEGVEMLNMVHRRAYGINPSTPSSIDYNIGDHNLDSFIDLVMTERMYETIFEGKRWLDLKRTGKARDAILEVYGITVAEQHMLWPIPPIEYEFNGAIDPETDQNPGY